ncbi:MAG: phosphodiester glycosidase family protein [Bacteroidales bacterium]|nr:phosphodiester glycosidase family protein [Bacteroidales bacterium]
MSYPKKLCLITAVCCLITVVSCRASNVPDTANADSLAFCTAQWDVDEQAGFTVKKLAITDKSLFESNQFITLIVIPPNSKRRLAFTMAKDTLLTTSELAQRTDAVAAINGSFFDMKYFNPVCYLRINGVELGENTPGKDDTINRKYYQYASIKLRNGKPRLFIPDSNRLSEHQRPDSNIMTAGPMLLWRGERVPQRDDRTFVTNRHNRTALGITADGTVILLTADGRFKNIAEGLSLTELESVMKWLGCVNAINLDGGGSTTMFVKGRPNGGIITHPSDNNKFDYQGERPVSNAILIL